MYDETTNNTISKTTEYHRHRHRIFKIEIGKIHSSMIIFHSYAFGAGLLWLKLRQSNSLAESEAYIKTKMDKDKKGHQQSTTGEPR